MDRKEFIRQSREIQESEGRHQAAKIKSSLIPGGTTAYETFKVLVKPLHEKRKDQWLYLLMSDLVRREEKDLIDLEELSKNEEFITIISKATIFAQQNHQKEKIQAFKAIVINSLDWLGNGESVFDWAERFLRIVDEISPLHILILKTFSDPSLSAKKADKDFRNQRMMNSLSLFCQLYPDLRGRASLIELCWKDLYSYDFVSLDNMKLGNHKNGNLQKLTTDFGDKFLEMIESDD